MTRLFSLFHTALCCLAFVFTLPALGDGLSNDARSLSNCAPERGKTLFNKCAVCHNYDRSQTHGVVGPNLYQTLDRPVGKIEGYKFSSAMRKSEDRWTVEFLDSFLKQPMAVYPRTRMAFAGISNAQDRADLICFLAANQINDN